MQFENSRVTLGILIDYGSLMSTNKSDFLEKKQRFIDTENYSLTVYSVVDCFLYDVKAVVQISSLQHES